MVARFVTTSLLIMVASVFFIPGVTIASDATATESFREANQLLHQKRYDEALSAYDRVMEQASSDELKQGALYWKGQTYFRQGRFDQAQQSFQLVIADYPNSTIAPKARQMLQRIQQGMEPIPELTFRQIQIPRDDYPWHRHRNIALSPDGKRAVCVGATKVGKGRGGVESIRSAEGGQEDFFLNEHYALILFPTDPQAVPSELTLLLSEPREARAEYVSPTWSPDGKWIAFYRYVWESFTLSENEKRAGRRATGAPVVAGSGIKQTGLEIYLIPADGGEMSLLAPVKFRTPNPKGLSWSPDSRYVAFVSSSQGEDDEHTDIYVASVDTREVRPLTTDHKQNSNPRWLPDGKRIVYNSRRGVWFGDGRKGWVQSVDGGEAVKWNYPVGVWSPDGTMVAYKGYASGKSGFFAARVNPQGAMVGEPVLLKAAKLNLGRAVLSWQTDGSIFYFWEDYRERSYLVDLNTGQQSAAIPDLDLSLQPFQWVAPDQLFLPMGRERRAGFLDLQSATFTPILLRGFDGMSGAKLSPDAQMVAFSWIDPTDPRSSDDTKQPNLHLYTVPVSGEVPVQLTDTDSYDGDIHWSPDGQRLAFTQNQIDLKNKDFHSALCVIPSAGGMVRTLTEGAVFGYIAWSPDSSMLAYLRLRIVKGDPLNPEEMDGDIYVVRTDGSEPQRITHTPEMESDLAWSPDGKWLQFSGQGQNWVVSVADGNVRSVREIGRAKGCPVRAVVPHGWLPQGASLLTIGYSTVPGGKGGQRFWHIPVDGGEPVELGIAAPSSGHPVALSPDGQTVMFRENRSENQYWLMEGVQAFLAKALGEPTPSR